MQAGKTGTCCKLVKVVLDNITTFLLYVSAQTFLEAAVNDLMQPTSEALKHGTIASDMLLSREGKGSFSYKNAL